MSMNSPLRAKPAKVETTTCADEMPVSGRRIVLGAKPATLERRRLSTTLADLALSGSARDIPTQFEPVEKAALHGMPTQGGAPMTGLRKFAEKKHPRAGPGFRRERPRFWRGAARSPMFEAPGRACAGSAHAQNHTEHSGPRFSALVLSLGGTALVLSLGGTHPAHLQHRRLAAGF